LNKTHYCEAYILHKVLVVLKGVCILTLLRSASYYLAAVVHKMVMMTTIGFVMNHVMIVSLAVTKPTKASKSASVVATVSSVSISMAPVVIVMVIVVVVIMVVVMLVETST